MKEEQHTGVRRRWHLWTWVLAWVLALSISVVSGAAVTPLDAKIAAVGEVNRVIPIGRAVGIKLFSDGVMVVGLSEVATSTGAESPAKSCGLREGDIITHINSVEVDSIESVQSVLQDLSGAKMSIRAVRGEKELQMTAQAVQCSTDGAYKLGAWIRDSMAGIGTVTFYDPASGVFGALGHGINDVDTALLMPLQSGSIMYAEVVDVKRGQNGTPGELHGAFQVSRDMGALYANTASGVFGLLTDETLAGTQPVEVAARREVRVGEAVILSNIAGEQVEEYAVEITHVYPENSGDTRNLMIKVTDPRLLEATGGIVQGMSGSPILQNGRLVGAVTHVLVNDPTEGYGILAENMLHQAGESARSLVS
ncbi:MAG: SpoIVB peptidase [Oscillospiraceae bacterium]|nr:SpoIVB peptidase [Oscillospiraceae bacterium]